MSIEAADAKLNINTHYYFILNLACMNTADSVKKQTKGELSRARLILNKAIKRMLEINKQLKCCAQGANVRFKQGLKAELKLLNAIIEQQAQIVKAHEMQLQQL